MVRTGDDERSPSNFLEFNGSSSLAGSFLARNDDKSFETMSITSFELFAMFVFGRILNARILNIGTIFENEITTSN
jgi:hypothetical protein